MAGFFASLSLLSAPLAHADVFGGSAAAAQASAQLESRLNLLEGSIEELKKQLANAPAAKSARQAPEPVPAMESDAGFNYEPGYQVLGVFNGSKLVRVDSQMRLMDTKAFANFARKDKEKAYKAFKESQSPVNAVVDALTVPAPTEPPPPPPVASTVRPSDAAKQGNAQLQSAKKAAKTAK